MQIVNFKALLLFAGESNGTSTSTTPFSASKGSTQASSGPNSNAEMSPDLFGRGSRSLTGNARRQVKTLLHIICIGPHGMHPYSLLNTRMKMGKE